MTQDPGPVAGPADARDRDRTPTLPRPSGLRELVAVVDSARVDIDPRLAPLEEARARGGLGPLDLALARFALERSPGAPLSFVQAVAWLGRAASLGHGALELDRLARSGPELLGWPALPLEAWTQARAVLPADGRQAAGAWADAGAVLQVVDPADRAAALAGSSPWVLDGDRLYPRRTWRAEQEVAADLRRRAASRRGPLGSNAPTGPTGAGGDAEPDLEAWLDRLFPGPDPTASADQRAACRAAARADLAVITGGPGTGKTYTAARVLVLLHALSSAARPLRVGLAAPTGKAAARLRQSLLGALEGLAVGSGIPRELLDRAALAPARTLHAWLGLRGDGAAPAFDPRRPLPLDLMLLDEASMVDLAMMSTLLAALPAGARLVLLGDPDQLASVEAGSVLADLCRAPAGSPVGAQTVRLGRSRRFTGPIAALAAAVRDGDARGVAQGLPGPDDPPGGDLACCPLPPERAEDPFGPAALDGVLSTGDARPGHGLWLSRLGERPGAPEAFASWVREQLGRLEAFRVLCALREGPRGVAGWNAAIERAAVRRGWIQRRGEWYDGRPVMVTRNDPGLDLFNGDIGLVLRSPSTDPGQAPGLRAWFLQGTALRSVAVGRLPPVETAFALTVHKSQGSEFAHVMLVLPDADQPALTRELLYTAITRARRVLTLAMREPAVIAAAVERVTVRMGGWTDDGPGG